MIKMTKLEETVYNAIRGIEQDGELFDFHDICLESDMEGTRARGVIASLVKKGLVVSTKTAHEDEVIESYATRTIEEVEAEMATRPIVSHERKSKEPKIHKITNASRVRDKIAEVKSEMSKEEAQAIVVQFCMEQLGQSKQLANTYFMENWERV